MKLADIDGDIYISNSLKELYQNSDSETHQDLKQKIFIGDLFVGNLLKFQVNLKTQNAKIKSTCDLPAIDLIDALHKNSSIKISKENLCFEYSVHKFKINEFTKTCCFEVHK